MIDPILEESIAKHFGADRAALRQLLDQGKDRFTPETLVSGLKLFIELARQSAAQNTEPQSSQLSAFFAFAAVVTEAAYFGFLKVKEEVKDAGMSEGKGA